MRELLKHIDFLPFGRFRTLLLISCFAMGISLSSSAQQEWVFTQYSFNLYDVNAAAVGDGQQNSIALRARKQWTGIKGAPESIHASFQKPFETRNLSWGVQLFSEKLGAHQSTSIEGTGAYRLRINENQKLSFALEAGLVNYNFDPNRIEARDEGDATLAKFQTNNWSPLFNAAAYWRSKTTYAGLELSRLTSSKLAADAESRQSPQVKLILGNAFRLNNSMVIRPSALIRYSNTSLQWEGQAAVLLRSMLWLGMGYRSDFGLFGYAEVQFSSRLRLGYSYDLASSTPFQTGASHELFLGFQWATKSGGSSDIRYF